MKTDTRTLMILFLSRGCLEPVVARGGEQSFSVESQQHKYNNVGPAAMGIPEP